MYTVLRSISYQFVYRKSPHPLLIRIPSHDPSVTNTYSVIRLSGLTNY